MVHFVPRAVMKDVPIKQRREEYVSGMVPRSKCANMKDVPIKQRREEFVSGMEERLIAAMRGAPTK